MPKPYPPEFRRRAMDLVASGRTVVEVAELLGIAQSCLYGWKSRDLVERGLKAGTTVAQSAELVAAQERIRDLEEEVKILRKAAAAVEAVVPQKTGSVWSPTWPLTGSGSAGPVTPWGCHGPASTSSGLGRRRRGRSGMSG